MNPTISTGVSRTARRILIGLLVVAMAIIFAPDTSPAHAAADNQDSVGLVDVTTGIWNLRDPLTGATTQFYYGVPGDYPMMGDWDCDGIDTPGLYRQSDGFVYLRNSNSQGIADLQFFFGDPGDIPLAGDFNGNGCDTVSIYRASEGQVYIVNALGANNGGLGPADYSYYFGNPGDKPFTGDFNNNGTDTVGLHRESTGLMYYRNTNTQGNAEFEFIYGDPSDLVVAGSWAKGTNPQDTVGVYRPSDATFYLRYTNTAGNADEVIQYGNSNMVPVAGYFGPANSNPTVEITSPADMDTFFTMSDGSDQVVDVMFAADVSDPDGDPVTVTWSSSVQGVLGTGTSLNATLKIPTGQTTSQPTITATATDNKGGKSSASIKINLAIKSP